MSKLDQVKRPHPEARRASSPAGSTIRVVSARTGLSMDMLRVWERRYGFPKPRRRTGSNRRLYDEADVQKLVAIARALDRGYRVGDVVDKSLEELAAFHAEANDAAPLAALAGVDQLLEILASDDVGSLEAELRRLAAALGARRFVVDVAQPFAVAVGAAWEDGRIAVRHEHVATECLTTQLRAMLAGYQDLDARPRVLLATLPGEQHTLALDMVALYLAVSGAKPRLLGASTPPSEIVDGVRAYQVDVAGITVGPTADPGDVRRGVRALVRDLPEGIPLWIGGRGATSELQAGAPTAAVVTTWGGLDAAVAAWRARGTARRGRA